MDASFTAKDIGSFAMLYMSVMQRAGIAAVAIGCVWAVILLAIWN